MKNPFDIYTQNYDRWYDKNRYIFLSELRCIKKAIGRVNLKNKKTVEIGVGTGRFASKLGIKYGVDISKNSLKFAAKRGIKTYFSDAEKLPFGNDEFDYAFMIFSICFFKKPVRVLKEVQRILKRNGVIIIAMINANSKLARYYKKNRYKNIFYRNAKFYKPENIIKKLKKTGFYKIETFQTLLKISTSKDFKNLKKIETPIKGHNRGSVVVIKGVKK
jgi:ubiquinone/menaquinone biosynthesis C-methylase UbiE